MHEIVAEKDFDLNRFFGWVKSHARFEILENVGPEEIFRYTLFNNVIVWTIQFRELKGETMYIMHPQVMLHYTAMITGKPLPVRERLSVRRVVMMDPWTKEKKIVHRPGPKSPGKKRNSNKKARFGSNCFFCTKDLGADVTIEHLVPRSKGGKNHPANLRLAHAHCNNLVGNMDVEDKAKLFPGPFEGVDMELLRFLQANNWKDPR